jgi:hypothetical protein
LTLPRGEVAVEVGEQSGDERHERLAHVLWAHGGDLVWGDECRADPKCVRALHLAAYSPLGDH